MENKEVASAPPVSWLRIGANCRLLWLCGALLFGLLAHSALAQSTTTTPTPAAKQKKKGQPVLLSADEITNDDQLELVIAKGNVEMSQDGRTLLADVVSYNRKTDTAIASGHVSLIQEDTGETLSASYMELNDNMREGFIRDVRALLSDRSRLAANTGLRTEGPITQLRRAVYSPCDLCQNDPTKAPIWQIIAESAVRDQVEERVRYYDAEMDIYGIPIFWTPYLSHPDPSAKRASGFLTPSITGNQIIGLGANIPYYWAIDTDKDLTIDPTFTTDQGVVLDGVYRQAFGNGMLNLRGSVSDSNPNPDIGGGGSDRLRGHFNGTGTFDINDDLRASFQIQRASDVVYLEEFQIGQPYNFMESNAKLEDFNGRNYGSVVAYNFQSFQYFYLPTGPVALSSSYEPIVLPVVNYEWASPPTSWGGKFTTTVGGIDVLRPGGPSSRRISAGTEMDLPLTLADGENFNFVAAVRGDGYDVQDGTTGRIFPQVGVEWRYPFARHDSSGTWIVEPRAALYAAPVGLNPTKIPNYDSVNVDFSDADLFVRNRFTGYDQVDSGQRVDYGLHFAWQSTGVQTADALFGQSYRFQEQSPFDFNGFGDGLDRKASDYVGHLTFKPLDFLDLAYHFRLDEQSLSPQRQETSAIFTFPIVHFSMTYAQVGENLRDEALPRQQVAIAAWFRADDYWTFSAGGSRDLQGNERLTSAQFAARYTDECLTFQISLNQDGVVLQNYRPGLTVQMQLVLKNLGEILLPTLEAGGAP